MLALKQVPAVKGLWEKASSPTSSRIKVGRGHRQLLSYLAAPSWQASRDRIIMLLMSPPRLALTRRSQSCHMCRTLKDIPHAIQMSYCSAGRLSNAQMGSTGEKKTPIKALYQQTGSSQVMGQVLLTGFGGVLYFRDPLTTK